jgi:carbon-monoxide dehydrogenase small subunit
VSHDRPAAATHRLRIALTVNGERVEREVPTTQRLLNFLRDELRLTGAKEVCAEGECGACSVLMNGKAVNSCLVLAVEADGAEIVTVEGLSHPIAEAMIATHAVQCGYCFPGMVIGAVDFLADDPNPDRLAIKAGMAGNICRCTGYNKIIEAVARCAARSSEGDTP